MCILGPTTLSPSPSPSPSSPSPSPSPSPSSPSPPPSSLMPSLPGDDDEAVQGQQPRPLVDASALLRQMPDLPGNYILTRTDAAAPFPAPSGRPSSSGRGESRIPYVLVSSLERFERVSIEAFRKYIDTLPYMY